ncbi:hypothetical protein [Bifidobacterium moukalabense]|uniref:hypothetical protein n=1 Tax=Bifidobacterium moukalabense TaxID=1333651 RepID=UPI0010F74E13|nr:hypothetical protein [Bifidobacterium moukalabense]
MSEDSDELMGLLYGEAKMQRRAGAINLTYHEGRFADYQKLERQSLIKVFCADGMPYTVDVTDEGWSYVEDWFLNQGKDDGSQCKPEHHHYHQRGPDRYGNHHFK